jgi:hypothetical protein
MGKISDFGNERKVIATEAGRIFPRFAVFVNPGQ